MRKMDLWRLSAKIRKLWKQVEDNREEMGRLIENHEAYTSERLVELDRETTRLGYEAKALEKQYMDKLADQPA